ncbi:coagulation factor VII isoform X1 [Gadus morhua]|uniref:coagulation factor VII isoform X1 n=1 Tax=Gadus morhua TaxID=8049 RepID=UPI0011B7F223|nr:coagulation factor VII-like isoform X1 [Gadus morhua]
MAVALGGWDSMLLLKLNLVWFTLHTSHSASVLRSGPRAHGFLGRLRRSNAGWFEELQRGDLERECLEERCSYEEAREVFEFTKTTDEFWSRYNTVDVCASGPCLNGGSCSAHGSSFICYCQPRFSGAHCQLKLFDVPEDCLLDNGRCEHFCEDTGGSRTCSCAKGYFLSADGRSCLTREPFACGTVPVLGNQSNALDPRARIVGGSECPKGECPWQVLLKTRGKGFCGGILISPRWVLTASHCLEDIQAQNLQVVAGEHDTVVEEGTEQVLQVSRLLMHEAYVPLTADSDVALLRLAAPVRLSPYALPVCLPTRRLAERQLWAVGRHTVSGWGRRGENGPTSRLLLRARVPRIRTRDCEERSGVRITANMFCAGFLDGTQDSCKGDSGGPLVTQYRSTAFLLGIVSWGKGCARPGNYGIYTRVSNYLDWIHAHTQEVDGNPTRTQEVDGNPTRTQEVDGNPTRTQEVDRNPTRTQEVDGIHTSTQEVDGNHTRTQEVDGKHSAHPVPPSEQPLS